MTSQEEKSFEGEKELVRIFRFDSLDPVSYTHLKLLYTTAQDNTLSKIGLAAAHSYAAARLF